MKSRPVLTAALLTLPLAVQAQETGGAPPEGRKGTVLKGKAPVAKEVLRVRLPRPEAFTLPNGTRVFVLADHRLPTVSFSLIVKAGSLYETRPGVAQTTAAML